MVVGYILRGAIAGPLAFVVGLLLGYSPWVALGLYTLIGSATLVLIPVTRKLIGNLADQDKALTATVRWNPRNYSALKRFALNLIHIRQL